MSFKRNTSIMNQALNRLLTQRKTIPLLNDEQGVQKLEQFQKGREEQLSKTKQMNVQFESGSDLEESDISDEKKDPLNDTNSNANQDIAALNA